MQVADLIRYSDFRSKSPVIIPISVILLDNNLPGVAWALARPMHESFVRGSWLLNHASKINVIRFIKGKCPKFPELLKDIGDAPETGGCWIKKMTELNIKNFTILLMVKWSM